MEKALEYAWLAGIFEGEGCIMFVGQNSVCLRVAMSDLDVVEAVQRIAGVGAIYTYDGPKRRKQMWVWVTARAEDVLHVLDAIEPYFHSRRAARAMAARERVSKARRLGYCKKGHVMTGDNLYVSPKGKRKCLPCMKQYGRDRRARLRSTGATL